MSSVEITNETLQITIEQPEAATVTVVTGRGPQGIQGEPGEPGEQGEPGESSIDYMTHSQNVPATVWTVAHNLGKNPSVTTEDSAGTVIEGDIDYVDINNLTVTYSTAVGGLAHCN